MRLSFSTLASLAAIIFAVGAEEALAYWWMHPAPAGLGEPVLRYRPGIGARGSRIEDSGSKIADRGSKIEEGATDPAAGDPRSTIHDPLSTIHYPQSTIPDPRSTIHYPQSTIHYPLSAIPDPQSSSVSAFSFTPLPEVVARALPSLHCSNGAAARIDRNDGVTINLAFFEWDLVDSTSVLESFKHLPEQCMGSIGLTLTGHQPPRFYQVGAETLAFDHTVFRTPAGGIVHAFKGIWVSGMSSLIGDGFRGGADHLRQIRWKAAVKRFHPAYASVAQGAVHGIANPDLAWETFQQSMLVDLRMEG